MDVILSLDALGAYAWLAIPFGIFLGFRGYQFYRVSLFIIGLFLGFSLGSWMGGLVDNQSLGLVIGLIMGLALGVAANFLIRFSLFLAGMTGAVILASLILPNTGLEFSSAEILLWNIGAALLGGLLMLAFYKILIYFVTSLLGAYLVYAATFKFFPPDAERWAWLLYVVLMFVFVLVQISSQRGRPDPVKREKERRR